MNKLIIPFALQIPIDLSVHAQQHRALYSQLHIIGCGDTAQIATVPWRSLVQHKQILRRAPSQ